MVNAAIKPRQRTTGIEWTDHTWNPFIGCSIKSAGCHNCYAMALAERLEGMGQGAYRGLTKNVRGKTIWTGAIRRNTDTAFYKPNKIAAPSIIFVNSMSDFFHSDAPNELQIAAWNVMVAVPRHQYQVLTKRPENIAPFLKRNLIDRVPPHIWLGTTVESESVADRIEILRKVPAPMRFLSVEPLIAPLGRQNLHGIHWVITGGESGPGARPMQVEWMREVRDLCLFYHVRHFFKQWGKPENNPLWLDAPPTASPSAFVKARDPVGKGGSLLDGMYWKQMPEGHKVLPYAEGLQEDLFKA